MTSKQRCALRKRLRAKGFDEEYIAQEIRRREADTVTAIVGERTRSSAFPKQVRSNAKRKQIIRRFKDKK